MTGNSGAGSTTRRRFLAGAGAAMAAVPLSARAAPGKAPVAVTAAGRVRGVTDGGVHAFRGVPYGAPTGGANRFRAPQPVVPWKGIRDATQYGSASPQHPDQAFDDRPDAKRPSEDCLMVNIWTPGFEPDAKRPVMVWFHGGGFAVGSGQEYVNDGTNLARRQDVVVVGVNHRLNVFGYTNFGSLVPPGAAAANAGHQDLVAALRWVRDNIAAFGGDPGNVTIFGQSGGGRKVSNTLVMPSARGLFHKAIMQSGFSTSTTPMESAEAMAARLFAAAGLSPGDIAGLRALSTRQVLDAYWQATGGVPLAGTSFVEDGEIVGRQPFVEGGRAPSPDVPVLMGHCAQEATVLFPPAGAFTATWETLPGLFGGSNPMTPAASVREVGPLIEGFRRIRPEATASDLYFAIATEAGMGRNARLTADNRVLQGNAPVFRYLVAWQTSVEGGRLGATHGTELPMVFDSVQQKFGLIGDDRAAYQQMADIVSPMWARFARTGNPSAPGLPEWPAYKPGERALMVFDKITGARRDPLGVEQALIDEYY